LTEVYRVTTPDFAGPMDLLVFLVRRRELDVAFISVSAIAADYLAWLDRIDPPNLDNAGDFILLAAILLQLKAAELLPTPQVDISDLEMAETERQLSSEELLALKRSVTRLVELEERQINLFDRGGVHLAGLEEELAGEMLSDVSLYDIAVAFRDLIHRLPSEPTHVIEDIPFTLEGQMAFIIAFFERSRRVAFNRLAEALDSRLAVIMTFLAMLELMRLRRIVVRQHQPFGQLWLVIRGDSNLG